MHLRVLESSMSSMFIGVVVVSDVILVMEMECFFQLLTSAEFEFPPCMLSDSNWCQISKFRRPFYYMKIDHG